MSYQCENYVDGLPDEERTYQLINSGWLHNTEFNHLGLSLSASDSPRTIISTSAHHHRLRPPQYRTRFISSCL
uniref:Uncharacterized protein n=1 Tax=Moniliophthora roreri TaxID=221103 RepID=A0A0W0FNB2_MONRR